MYNSDPEYTSGSSAFECDFYTFTVFQHILFHIQNRFRSRTSPIFVALQGPQGSGKTSVVKRVKELLAEDNEDHEPYHVATLSIDDLYLPHAQLKSLASAHPDNPFLRGRGLPGTHDIQLGLSLLRSLKDINRSKADNIRIPRFDKSLFDGEGDRLPESEWTPVHGPLDVVLLEGWCVGFHPQSRQYIDARMNDVPFVLNATPAYSLEHVLDVNQRVAEYIEWWNLFDICVQISPQAVDPYVPIYKWRLQQEQEMKAKNGGQGMTDEQVKTFVNRYIPGYHFLLESVTTGAFNEKTGSYLSPPWMLDEPRSQPARCIRIIIDDKRVARGVEYCRRQ